MFRVKYYRKIILPRADMVMSNDGCNLGVVNVDKLKGARQHNNRQKRWPEYSGIH
jgi:hypothetical protein